MQNKFKEIRSVTLMELLDARERRAELQKKLISEYGVTLVSFTMNIAGPVKNSPLIERAFEYGLEKLHAVLPNDKVLFEKITSDPCGCEAMISVDLPAGEVKQMCVNIEEESRLGRLFDIDVLDVFGKKLDREEERACIVCGKAGRGCAAGRVHSADELVAVTNKIITEHFMELDACRIGKLTSDCLIKEVETTPKPGLVDLSNSGSHADMDADSFKKSAAALTTYFIECVKIGIESREQTSAETFNLLRAAGISAEKTMYKATGGVNTHKGAIYSFGVLLGAVGRLWTAERPIADRAEILHEAGALVGESVKSDLSLATGSTAGERLYLENGLSGIRGEVASGFSSVTKYALPVYESEIKKGASENDAGVLALVSLISVLDDTNMYHRGGKEGAEFAKKYAKDLIEKGFSIADVSKMDEEFIHRNLSSGGAADLLAVTIFLFDIEKYK